LAETLETNLVLIMRTEDYYRCAKNSGSLKSNRNFLQRILTIKPFASNRSVGTTSFSER